MMNYFFQPARRASAQRAFTLIEILVVLAVVLMLTAILLPVLGRVRESGRTRACLSNLKQLGLAFQQYRTDWSGRFPAGGSFRKWDAGHWVGGNNGENIGDFSSTLGAAGLIANAASSTGYNQANPSKGGLFQYVKNNQVYICPSDTVGTQRALSYSLNCAIQSMSEIRIKQPTDIIMLVDEAAPNDGYFFATNTALPGRIYTTTYEGFGAPSSTDALTVRHNGGGNLLFVDAHVKWYGFNSFPVDGSAAGLLNKERTTGTPRFHDPAFGKQGSYDYNGIVKIDSTTGLPPATGASAANVKSYDSCGVVLN